MRWVERFLFGRDGVARAEAAERRLQAAIEGREKVDADLEKARENLRLAVNECEIRTRKLTSDYPPVVRFVVADELDPRASDPRASRP